MNWLDILLIIINTLLLLFGIISIILAIITKDELWDYCIETTVAFWIFYLMLGWLLIIPFIVVDKGVGSTIGTITSVDKNFFGTTAVYIKTSESSQEKYCIEDKKLAKEAFDLIDKKVKVSYGTRVGFYSTGKCSQAPLEKIEEIEE